MSSDERTLEQAVELLSEQILELLDGCDDGDTVRPDLVLEALRQVWAPGAKLRPLELTAGELRARIADARAGLARGELVTWAVNVTADYALDHWPDQ
jgi:hypothetical protein